MKYLISFLDIDQGHTIVEAPIINVQVDGGCLFVAGYSDEPGSDQHLVTELIAAPGSWSYTRWVSD